MIKLGDYPSIEAFAKAYGLESYTVRNHLKAGKCNLINKTHGLDKHPLKRVWACMKSRCSNPKLKEYKNYGGRGIKVCARWYYDFSKFVEDMGERPVGHTLDRIDNDGDYTPENCRWACKEDQVANSRLPSKTRGESGIKYITRNNKSRTWRVEIRDKLSKRGRRYWGEYASLEEAKSVLTKVLDADTRDLKR